MRNVLPGSLATAGVLALIATPLYAVVNRDAGARDCLLFAVIAFLLVLAFEIIRRRRGSPQR